LSQLVIGFSIYWLISEDMMEVGKHGAAHDTFLKLHLNQTKIHESFYYAGIHPTGLLCPGGNSDDLVHLFA
jgi:hypothetical protein